MLTYLDLKNDLYRMIGVATSTARTDMVAAVKLAILQAQQYFCLHGDWGFLQQYRDVIYIPIKDFYDTGYANVTQDSKAVTGGSTVWTADMVGQFFQLTNKEFYEIQSFTSGTAITLSIPFQGTTDVAGTATYAIKRRYYDLPLDFLRPLGRQARLTQPDYGSEWLIDYQDQAGVRELQTEGRPTYFAIYGNSRRSDYYNTSTVTIATSGSTSTWTMASGTLPTDIVDREIRIKGEDKAYRIATRATAATLTTYDAYVNPSDGTGTQSTASTFAITPKETMQICFNPLPSQRYTVWLPYIKKLPQLLADTDISAVSSAGYDEALLACCRAQLALDGRTAQRADAKKDLLFAREDAMMRAWSAEQIANNDKLTAEGSPSIRRKAYPSWISQ
jgi:hypothetical protein